MLKPTEAFLKEVRQSWGSPAKVADAALSELFRHGDEVSLDYDDQVDYAKRVGVLAGVMKDSTSDEFIAAFTERVLNE